MEMQKSQNNQYNAKGGEHNQSIDTTQLPDTIKLQ